MTMGLPNSPTNPARRPQDDRPVLIILHQAHSIPGRIGVWLRSAGYRLDIRRPRFGDALPATMDDHAGAVIFGGPMSANDPEDFIKREIDWIAVPLKEQRPFLGICLGAQMMAKHLGAPVGVHAEGNVEVGYYPIESTAAGRALGPWPCHFYQWHREGFDLPAGARHLARTETYENQAMSYGPAALAVQFHPEITYAMVNRWTTAAAARLQMPGARARTEHFQGHHRFTHNVGGWLDRVMPLWLAGKLDVSDDQRLRADNDREAAISAVAAE